MPNVSVLMVMVVVVVVLVVVVVVRIRVKWVAFIGHKPDSLGVGVFDGCCVGKSGFDECGIYNYKN